MKVVISYKGTGAPNTLPVNLSHNADADRQTFKRATYMDTKGRLTGKKSNTLILQKGVNNTFVEIVYFVLGDNTQDLLSSISIATSYHGQDIISGCGTTNPCPVLASTPKTTSEAAYALKCSGKVCKPYLIVQMYHYFTQQQQQQRDIIYGVTSHVMINITINNIGDPGYQPKLHLDFHSDLELVDVKMMGGSSVVWENQQHVHIPSTIAPNTQYTITLKLALAKHKPSVALYRFMASMTAIGNIVELKFLRTRNLPEINTGNIVSSF